MDPFLRLVQLCGPHSPRDSHLQGLLPRTQRPPPTSGLPQPTRHLPLATAGPIRSRVQLRATKAFHQAPQRLADILENKCEVVLFIFQHLHRSVSTVTVKHTHSSPVHAAVPSEQEGWPGSMRVPSPCQCDRKEPLEHSQLKCHLDFVIIPKPWCGDHTGQ